MATIKSKLEVIEKVEYMSPTDNTDKNRTWKILISQAITGAQIGQVDQLLNNTPTSEGFIMPPKRIKQPIERYLTSTRNYWSKTLGNWKVAENPPTNAWTNKSSNGRTKQPTLQTPAPQLAAPTATTVPLTACTKLQAELKNITAKFQEYLQGTKSEKQKLSTTLQAIRNNQEPMKQKQDADEEEMSTIQKIKAQLKNQTAFVKYKMEQINDCYNKLNAQEQTIGQHHRRHLELEAKTDQNQNQITTQLKAITAKVNIVTTKTRLLEQCFE